MLDLVTCQDEQLPKARYRIQNVLIVSDIRLTGLGGTTALTEKKSLDLGFIRKYNGNHSLNIEIV